LSLPEISRAIVAPLSSVGLPFKNGVTKANFPCILSSSPTGEDSIATFSALTEKELNSLNSSVGKLIFPPSTLTSLLLIIKAFGALRLILKVPRAEGR